MVSAGRRGPEVRSDLWVKVEPLTSGGIELDVKSKVDFMYGEANRKLVEWVSSGQLKYRETIVEGLEKAPNYFNWLFEGRNFGKLIVQVAKEKP
jgi:NADPH-dependent curcumin reductase CurA